MRQRVFLFLVILMSVFSQNIYSGTRLSILRPKSSVTHQWQYLPSGETVTQQGLRDKQYPLSLNPLATYLQSEEINVEGCDLGMTVRYYVSTVDTHALKFELVDADGKVWYSFIEENPELNTSTMTIGHDVHIGKIKDAKKVMIKVSLSDAYKSDESINIDELELYSHNGAGINDVIDDNQEIKIVDNSLIINSIRDSYIEICDLSGKVIKNDIYKGENQITLPFGFYIIKFDDNSIKKVYIH
ncbi:MAG: hypothetical protein E7081_07715 [Bacteroidales bacterium]|nr:hypothetical protein [Bacteroidales bacterium]